MPDRLDALRSAYELLRKPGGLAILAEELLAPDVELDFSALPDGRVLKGVDAFREFRQDRPWVGQLSLEPEEMIEVEGRFAHLLTFGGDRVVRWKLFSDRAEARRAAGLDAA